MRPGGIGPIFAWGVGRDLLQLTALALLGTGAIWSFLHRPFLPAPRAGSLLILVFVVGAGAYPFPYPSSHEGHRELGLFPPAVRSSRPRHWTVFWGGETKEENLLVGYRADRRFGLDLVVARDGRTHRGDGAAAADYYCFGEAVLAPARGRS